MHTGHTWQLPWGRIATGMLADVELHLPFLLVWTLGGLAFIGSIATIAFVCAVLDAIGGMD
jgi:hypothetical protein